MIIFFDFLTIGTAAYIVVRHQIIPYNTSDISDLATAILAVLGLLTVSGLWERQRRLKTIQETITATHALVADKLGQPPRAADFFWDGNRKVTEADFSSAQNIYIVGMVLGRTVRDNMAALDKRVSAGGHLRFVLLNPHDTELMAMMPYRSYGSRDSQWWQNRITQTIGHIEDIVTSDRASGSIQIGLLPFFPSFGMWLIDPNTDTGKIIVEIYHHRTTERNPTFELHPVDDADWYKLFLKQFDLLWDACQQNRQVITVHPK